MHTLTAASKQAGKHSGDEGGLHQTTLTCKGEADFASSNKANFTGLKRVLREVLWVSDNTSRARFSWVSRTLVSLRPAAAAATVAMSSFKPFSNNLTARASCSSPRPCRSGPSIEAGTSSKGEILFSLSVCLHYSPLNSGLARSFLLNEFGARHKAIKCMRCAGGVMQILESRLLAS